jgi:hypothetical protein
VKLIDNKAVNTGQNSQWPNKGKFGFSLEYSYGAVPSDITITNSESIDNQASPTTYDGFYCERGRAPVHNVRITGSSAIGFRRSAIFGFERNDDAN